MKRKASRQKTSRRQGIDRKYQDAETSEQQTRPKETKQMSPESTASKGSVARPAPPRRRRTRPRPARRPSTGDDPLPRSRRYGGNLRRFDHRPDFRRSDIAHRIRRYPVRRRKGQHTDHRPALPACRLVLPPAAAVDLINRMQQIAAALTQAGVVKQAQRAAAVTPKAGDRRGHAAQRSSSAFRASLRGGRRFQIGDELLIRRALVGLVLDAQQRRGMHGDDKRASRPPSRRGSCASWKSSPSCR